VLGRAYRETDEGDADELTIIENFINGEYSRPVRVVAFNTHEGWSRNVTEEIALKLLDLSAAAREFVERVTGKAPTVISCRSGERLRFACWSTASFVRAVAFTRLELFNLTELMVPSSWLRDYGTGLLG
jgi:hypothetical protein